jgi:hypothetical protein
VISCVRVRPSLCYRHTAYSPVLDGIRVGFGPNSLAHALFSRIAEMTDFSSFNIRIFLSFIQCLVSLEPR